VEFPGSATSPEPKHGTSRSDKAVQRSALIVGEQKVLHLETGKDVVGGWLRFAHENPRITQKKADSPGRDPLGLCVQPVTSPSHAFAVIDGSLCQFGRAGGRALWHAPIATAVVEFRRGSLCTYVREHPYGLLPGLANLYCLDGAHRLQWMAEWPNADDPCAGIVDEVGGVLVAVSVAGAVVRLDAATGRLLGFALPVSAAS
jgi:hypothetical protein